MKNIPDIVSHDDIKEVLELSNSHVMRDMVDPVKRALEIFEKNISRLIFLPDIPRIEFRSKTMELFLDSISNELKGGQYKQFMRSVGKSVGKSLGSDMIEFFAANNKLPKDYEVLISLWNEWDLIAGWGRRTYFIKGDEIVITVDDSFLTRAREDDKHKHCAFLEGYIQGYLREVIREQYRWFKRAITKPSIPPLKVVEIFEKPSGDKCQFMVKLKEEELREAFDLLSEARESLKNGEFDKCASSIRTSMEIALKEKLCINKNEKTPILKILTSLKSRNVNIRYRTIEDVYAAASNSIHGSRKASKSECIEMLEKWDNTLEEIESISMLEKEKHDIVNELLGKIS